MTRKRDLVPHTQEHSIAPNFDTSGNRSFQCPSFGSNSSRSCFQLDLLDQKKFGSLFAFMQCGTLALRVQNSCFYRCGWKSIMVDLFILAHLSISSMHKPEYRISASIGVDRNPSWLTFLPYHTCLFPACTNQLPVSLILIVVQFFTLMCHDITHSPYDRNTLPYADHLKPTNSNSLHNSHSFGTHHSQYTHHKDFSLSAPPSGF